MDRTLAPAPRSRRWLRRVGLAAVGMAGALVVGELGVRASAAWVSPRARVPDARLGWVHTPRMSRVYTNEHGERCTFATNKWGHRGGAVSKARLLGRFRALFLGDSFTEGIQVDQREVFTARLEVQKPEVEAINTGVSCYGTVQQLLYMRDEGVDFAPDLVVLMFYANDLADNVHPWFLGVGARPYAELRDGEVYLFENWSDEVYLPFCLPLPFRGTLFRHSELYQSINLKVWQKLFARPLIRRDEATQRRPSRKDQCHVFLAMLDQLREVVATRTRAEFAVVMIPTMHQVRRPELPSYPDVERGLRQRGLRVLHLAEALRAARADGEHLYFDEDKHWTKHGHAVAAREIARLVLDVQVGGR
ncbi:MAG: SGNH/GDSL hydrolase family protein [Planctomycetota bacterium]